MSDIADAVRRLEALGMVRRRRWALGPDLESYAASVIGRPIPQDLADLYRENLDYVGHFNAVAPIWSDYFGTWNSDSIDELLHVNAVPIFSDGSGNYFAVDLQSPGDSPPVYHFERAWNFRSPGFAVGSSIAKFLLLAAGADGTGNGFDAEDRDWVLSIDPDIEKCPRAPALWNTD